MFRPLPGENLNSKGISFEDPTTDQTYRFELCTITDISLGDYNKQVID